MAPALQSTFVDLTGEDENDDSIARAQAACEKAFAAASRMTNHFESMKIPKPLAYQGPRVKDGSTGKDIPSATVPYPWLLPRVTSLPQAAGSDRVLPKKDEMNKAIPRPNASVTSHIVWAPVAVPRAAGIVPAGFPSVSERTDRKEHRRRESKSVTPRTGAPANRTPRSAAISAKQNITETCSELEEWRNKDPDFFAPQASVGTPRRLKRQSDDLEEWSPSSNANHEEEEQNGQVRSNSYSPTPSDGEHEESTANGDNGLSSIQEIPTPQDTKKRKFSESSRSRESPAKLARGSEKPVAHHDSVPSNSSQLGNKKLVQNETASAEYAPQRVTAPLLERGLKAPRLERKSPGKTTVRTYDESLRKPSDADPGQDGALTKPSSLHTQEKADPRLQRNNEASGSLTYKPGLFAATPVPRKFSTLFESVVYPAIRKAAKRNIEKSTKQNIDGLSLEELDAIGKSTVDEVLSRLAFHSGDSYQLDDVTKKKAKKFVRKSFHQRVRKANVRSSHSSATPANDSSVDVAITSLDLSGLEGTSGGNSVLAGGHPPPTPGLDNHEKASSSWSTAAVEKAEGQVPGQSYPNLQNQQQALSLQNTSQDSHNESATPFGPNFDRGRYPAKRRRRGNKYCTPAKTPKSKPGFVNSHFIPSDDYLSSPPSGDSVDQTLSAPVSTQQRKKLGRIRHVASEPTNYADVSKAKGELLEDTSPPIVLQPFLCPTPATALDSSLEYVVAVLVTDTSSTPSQDERKYSITPGDRRQLVTDQSIVKHVDINPTVGKPKLVRIETRVVDPVRPPGRCIPSLLRNRELGLSSRGRHVGTVCQLHQLKSEMIEPWKNWKGASGDVVAVAWNPDSNVYAFGAAAHTNIEDIQYNRPCNLLLGNLTSNQLRELPDHRIDRPKPETIPNGPNATQAVYDACDPKVYETVTSIAFLPTGDRMLTASHDCTVKIWDVTAGKYQCLSTLPHEAWVTSVEVSEYRQGVFATASKSVKDAIRVYHNSADPSSYEKFSASRAIKYPDWKIYPECLRWGPNHHTSHLLLAGFQQWEQQGEPGGGQLCLWDANAFEAITVTPSSQSVFAAAWHPTQPFFATGGAPGNNITDKANTNTVVRTWDLRNTKRFHVEYECPATDMQDITLSPLDPNIVTAGCTDGVSYVWDCRRPDQVLHRLEHGKPLAELDHTRERQEADTGVMLSLWGPSGSLFYTGSSDGVIKAWDVRRHPQDVLISNVANFEVSVQSGAFSPDGNNLLVGDAEGGIHVLSSAPCGPRSNVQSTDAYIDLVRASNGSGLKLDQNDDNPGTEGVDAARTLIDSGQLEYHDQFGVGQGPKYQGPYAKYARKEANESGIGRLRKRFQKKQPISKRGEKQWDVAIPMTTLLVERKEILDREKDGDKTELDALGGSSPLFSTPQGSVPVRDASGNKRLGATVASGIEDPDVEGDTISESEMIEENYWWVRLGEEEVDLARAGRTKH